jgi:hypothetical protein
MAAFMTTRISAEMPPTLAEAPGEGSVARLPAFLHEPFAAAMSQSLLLPAFFALFGVVAAIFMLGFGDPDRLVEDDALEDLDRNAGYAVEYGGDETFGDDDDYLEYTVSWDEPEPVTRAEPEIQTEPVVLGDDSITEPMQSRADHVLHPPAEVWHGAPVESWHSLLEDVPETRATLPPEPEPEPEPPREAWRSILDELLSDVPARPKAEPIGFAHNGSHIDDEQRFQPLPPAVPDETTPSRHGRVARHHLHEEHPEKRPFWFDSNGRHSRADPDDASSYGRHSSPGRD